MNKQSRHFAIKQILQQQAIGSQEQLVEELADAGFDVTQATLSRDLKELGVARVNSDDGPRYMIHGDSREIQLQSLMYYEVQQIVANETMVVIKTLPGRAQGVSELIDRLKSPLILGTVAGDNTIFVSPVTTRKIPQIVEMLSRFVSQSETVESTPV